MWLASYVVHLRQVHWRAGADWLLAHLLDGDLASNHLSWQWVAGTGSHKPYLFNAENVARYAPPHWHSPGTVIDCGYDALDRAARAPRPLAGPGPEGAEATPEPPLLSAPPAGLGVQVLDAASAAAAARRLQGREVWLLHPWALRPPPAELPPDVVCVGLYPQEHHAGHPWPAARWRWVDAAMAAVAGERWYASGAQAATALAGAARVRSVADPHVMRAMRGLARAASAKDAADGAAAHAAGPGALLHHRVDWLPEPALFAELPRRCSSFSQWWTRVTRGLHDAQELLA
jgi:deoxyribodipyrimidine photo-lyase